MPALIVCSSCGLHARAHGRCDHCGASLRGPSGTALASATAVLMGLSLAGCPADEGDSSDDGASSATATATATATETNVEPLYGEPDPTNESDPGSSTSGEGSSSTGDDAESSSGTTGDTPMTTGESEYGVAET